MLLDSIYCGLLRRVILSGKLRSVVRNGGGGRDDSAAHVLARGGHAPVLARLLRDLLFRFNMVYKTAVIIVDTLEFVGVYQFGVR